VNLDVTSRNGWEAEVQPDSVTVQGEVTASLAVTIGVPVSPTHRYDVARLSAVSEASPPYTATAYLITLAHRHRFGDLPYDHWASDPVQYLVLSGVVSGYEDATFRPNNNVTRAQFAKMVVGAMEWPLVTPTTPTFADIPADHWAYAFVETAVAQGAIAGYGDGTFRPMDLVTRAQAAKVIATAREWQVEATTSSFADVSPDDWFFGFAEATNSAEVMTGYEDGTFRPYAPLTRAQMAKILTLGLFSEPQE
jgi:hypothetical protein